MTFEPFSPEDFWKVDVQEAQLPLMDACTQEYVTEAGEAGVAWTVRADDGEIIGCSGVIPQEPGVWLAWALFSEAIKGHGLKLIRFARNFFSTWPGEVEMYVLPEHAEAARFAEVLGFRFAHEQDFTKPSGASVHMLVFRRD